jgi:nucleotide-binding universal stress UspA family protein
MAELIQNNAHAARANEPAVPVTPPAPITKILVPFDFGDPAFRALAYARTLAEKLGASIELLHVVADPRLAFLPLGPGEGLPYALPRGFVEDVLARGKAKLERALSSTDRQALRATTKVAVGEARKEILACAEEAEANLIVMGTHGRKGVSHAVLGSVAERVVREAKCPVLIVR